MRKSIALLALLFLASASLGQAQDHRRERGSRRWQRQNEAAARATVYGKADDGTTLKWTVFPGAGPGPHPAVLVIHGGGFRREPNSPRTWQCAEETAAAGFNVFHVEYRLAAQRGLEGQQSSGHYPEQTNDLKIAVRAARQYAGGNNKVGAIGGSAGGAHDVYLAATGKPGDDRLDCAVSFSGAYDFSDPGSLREHGFRKNVVNYVGSAETEALRKASPITYVDASIPPLYVIASEDDAMPPQQYTDLIQKLKAVGATNFQQLLRPGRGHAFAYWPEVRERCLAFLKENLGTPGANPKR